MATQTITVTDRMEMDRLVNQYLVNGYNVSGQTEDSTVLRKAKNFSVPLALLGFLFCVVGLVVYVIVYSAQRDSLIEIRLDTTPKMSDDGTWWWDGQEWKNVETSAPPNARRSQDGRQWWDGVAWRELPS